MNYFIVFLTTPEISCSYRIKTGQKVLKIERIFVTYT